MCDGLKVLTWICYRPNNQEKSNTELHGGNCIQDARDPLVLPRYGVSPVIAKVSERVRVGERASNL